MSCACLCSCSPTLFTAQLFLTNIDHELYTVYLFILVGSMSVSYIFVLCTSGTGSVALRAVFNLVVRWTLCLLEFCIRICVSFGC